MRAFIALLLCSSVASAAPTCTVERLNSNCEYTVCRNEDGSTASVSGPRCGRLPPGSGGDAEPADAPILIEDIQGVSVRLRTGEPAPFDGQLLSYEEQIRRGRRLAAAEGELDKAHESLLISKPTLVAIVLGCIVAGAAVSAGVTLALAKK